jgi:branched-chain amino acid transport system ATP-binding protein
VKPYRHPVLWVAIVLVGLTLYRLAIGAPIGLITEIAIYTLYGAGVNLLVGYTGLVPFGASVFFGCASYAAAIAMLRFLNNEIAAIAFAVLFSIVLAGAIGIIILRRRGLYFSLLTLAFSQIAFEIAFKWTALTGGENGLQDVRRPMLANDTAFHIFTLASVTAGMWLLWRIAHAPFGRTLQALRDNEQRVRSLGYDTFRIKLGSFMLMAAVLSYAGALLAFMLRGAYADNLSWQHAGDALLMTVLGGVHQFLGPLWGAIAFVLLQDRLSAITESWWLIFAPIILVFALASPEGIQGMVQRLLRRPRWTLVRDEIPPRPAVIAPYGGAHGQLDPSKPILTLRGICKRFGSLVTATDIDLDVYPCRLHSLIGPNGAGKTTLFNMLTGMLRPDGGEIRFEGRSITRMAAHRRTRLGISRSFQILSVFPNLTTFENVRVAVQAKSPRQNALFLDAHGLTEVNARTWSLLDAVGLADRAAEPCANLAHGERRLLEIAVSLATDARLLLLDEPLAGLAEADRVVVARLIRGLAETHAVLLIEHDIDRVLALSDRISVLHQGRLIADGRPAEVGSNPAVIAAYLGTAQHAAAQAVRASAGSVAPIAVAGQRAERRLCRQRGAGRSVAGHQRGRGGGAAGPQRRGQDHDAACDHRHGARQFRNDRAGRQRHHAVQAVRDQPRRHLPGAGRPAAVPQPDGDRQSAAGGAAGRRLAGGNLRPVSEAQDPATIARRKPVRRRAPDGGDRARADGAGAADPAGRTVRGPGTGDRAGSDAGAGAVARQGGDGDRGAPRRDRAVDRRSRLCAGERQRRL